MGHCLPICCPSPCPSPRPAFSFRKNFKKALLNFNGLRILDLHRDATLALGGHAVTARLNRAAAGEDAGTTAIIPCFDDPDGLRRAARSVRLQQEPCELIVVDDGSRAACAAEIARIGQICNARVIRLPRRSGPAAARNAGLDAGTGTFVAFLDSDDVWQPGKLALQRAEMLRRGLVFSYMRYANVQGDRLRPMPAPDSLTRQGLMRDTAIGCSTVMLRRDFLNGRRFADAPSEDFAFWAKLLEDGETAHLVGEEVMVLRHSGGRSRNRLGAAWRHWRTLRGTLKTPLWPATGHFAAYAARAARKHWGPAGTPEAPGGMGVTEL